MNKFGSIVVDPPWSYGDKCLHRGGAERHYRTMDLAEIQGIPVASCAEESSHLWLWTTGPFLADAFRVMDGWGFKYTGTPLVWVKPRIGMGHYLRSAAEFCLLGVRGSAPARFRGQPSWFFAPVQEHSRKPEEFFSIVERMSPGPFLDLFARTHRPGWVCVGDELGMDIDKFFAEHDVPKGGVDEARDGESRAGRGYRQTSLFPVDGGGRRGGGGGNTHRRATKDRRSSKKDRHPHSEASA